MKPLNFVLFIFAVFVLAFFAPGIDFGPALIIAIILGSINGLIKPIFRWLHFPTSPLTLSLVTFVVMGLLALAIIPFIPMQHSAVENHTIYSYGGLEHFPMWLIFVFALILAVVNFLIQRFFPEETS